MMDGSMETSLRHTTIVIGFCFAARVRIIVGNTKAPHWSLLLPIIDYLSSIDVATLSRAGDCIIKLLKSVQFHALRNNNSHPTLRRLMTHFESVCSGRHTPIRVL
jgi:hypothetical protein